MKLKKYKEEEIFKILRESESGMEIPAICRRYGISSRTFYRWRSKYGGMELSDIKRLKNLQDENTQLKKLVADQALEIQAIKVVLEKKW